MNTRPLILDAESPFDEAKEIFKAGGIIAYPTETFYGLCVDPFNIEAVERLFSIKGRREKNPVSVLIKDIEMLKEVAIEIPLLAERLIRKFWPGPLTIVFRANPNIPPALIANTGKIGVRVSGSPVSMRLVEALSSPITATSANPSGKKPPIEAKEVLDYFDGNINLLIDGGRLGGRLGSTVIDITEGMIEVIREGDIGIKEILNLS
ncbi:MAG: threonylcarbamoyl-AMP synthase [Deltaproteobacteria bacterium]|nr:threonylcarbamoyl-AMP synthase [Deltaproteobacteria bacterium]